MGFAALTLAAAGGTGVTAEYKISMLSPAVGEQLIARGSVIKPGSTTSKPDAGESGGPHLQHTGFRALRNEPGTGGF